VTGTNVCKTALMRAATNVALFVGPWLTGSDHDQLVKSAPIGKAMWGCGGQTVVLIIPARLRVLLLSRLDLRNHRQITVIDDRITYCWIAKLAQTQSFERSEICSWVDIWCVSSVRCPRRNRCICQRDWVLHTGERS